MDFTSAEAIVNVLEHSQWWPPDVMRRHQLQLLAPLLAHAYETVPWYRRQFDALSITPHSATDAGVWQSIPLLTRADTQTSGTDLHSTNVPASHGRIARRWTSGSTAMPLLALRTELTSRVWIANTIRLHRWQRCDLNAKLAVIRPVPPGRAEPPDGELQGNWGTATLGRIQTGPCAVLGVKSTTEEQAAFLLRHQPAYLQSYPSILAELARYFVDRELQLASLRQVHTFGEVLEPRVRAVCRRAWGVNVLDAYSANEVGHVAIECAEGGNLHLQSEHLLVEVLDDQGHECQAGGMGKIVITDLLNYAMPLVRYEIGDFAEVGEPCCCGRRLPTLRRVLGRQRNMFIMPDGLKRWPALEVDAVGSFQGALPIRQFQAIQHTHDDIEVKLVVARPLAAAEEAGLRVLLAQWFAPTLRVQFNYVSDIARGPNGKFEDFRCELSQDG